MNISDIHFILPRWLVASVSTAPEFFASLQERMGFVIGLAHLNIEHETGGPFAAAVFEKDTGRLYAPGVNLVFSTNCSILHAEIVALIMAHKRAENFDLSAGMPELQLVTSAEPCAMCMGAVPWSGIGSIVCGARDEDVRKIGFDEGAKHPDWIGELNRRGIDVERDILRNDAVRLMERFVELGGEVY